MEATGVTAGGKPVTFPQYMLLNAKRFAERPAMRIKDYGIWQTWSWLYAARIDEKRAKGEPTVPTVLSRELATNPFLRADDADLRDRWGGNSPAETFAALRTAKDHF